MKKYLIQSWVVASCANLLTGIFKIINYYSNHSPIDWGLIRFALFMGYFQDLIFILPILFLCKIFLSKNSKIYYYTVFIIIFFSLYITFYPLINPEDVYPLMAEIVLVISFDYILFPYKIEKHKV